MNQLVNIRLPLTGQYLGLCEQLTREITATSGFSDTAIEMMVASVIEAVEELIRVTKEQGLDEYFELSFEPEETAIKIGINYNAKIALNPSQLSNYEIPSPAENISPTDLDGLWLHLIKSRMDRLFFETQGDRHVLKMIKYHREEGDDYKTWILNVIPCLKENVIIEYAQAVNGKIENALIQDPLTGMILHLGECEAWLLKQMDGRQSFDDIYMKYVAEHGLLSPIRIRFLYEKLESAGLIAGVAKDAEKQTKIQQIWKAVANPILIVPDTEKVINRIYGKVKNIINPAGFILFMLVGFSGLYPLLTAHFEYFKLWLPQLEQFSIRNPSALLVNYMLAMLMLSVHELSHGLVCRHYGGRVHRMGVMFYLISFLFFCDTSSAWNFKQKYQRILVSLAGPISTFAFLGMSLWLADFCGADPYWGSIWLIFALICFATLAMNFNPFIKMDAYYILVDFLELPRLRERSFQFLWQQLRFNYRKKDSIQSSTKITAKEETIFWFYGIVGVIMTFIFILLPIIYYGWLIINEAPTSGAFLLTLLILVLVLAQLSFRAFSWYRTQKFKKIKLS